ncbi:hypothetical protein NET03_09610 [Thermomicrobium sp. CFH 73360]|uniref:helix-turn-helix transcriptional regulator n=1 Tax=Thermomicrobium sp. CFH 73360 TaxID=2951987 RepID=UPI00207757D3|nr:hypothetical protein [Thermomicrobium sp. CFH 73360]MCM8746780.1 hypothetical protein [Thermomicrobium sp. CFH 73360]
MMSAVPYLITWRVVGVATLWPEDLLDALETEIVAAGFIRHFDRENTTSVVAVRGWRIYQDGEGRISLQVIPIWENGQWELHLVAVGWSDQPLDDSHLAYAGFLQGLPERFPVPSTGGIVERLQAGRHVPLLWSAIIDTPSAFVEAWLRDEFFPRCRDFGVAEGDPQVVKLDNTRWWVWMLWATPTWLSTRGGNWWVVPSVALVTTPQLCPTVLLVPSEHASLCLNLKEYRGKTFIQVCSYLPVHPIASWLVIDFATRRAGVLFPLLHQQDHRIPAMQLFSWWCGVSTDRDFPDLHGLSDGRRRVAELLMRGKTLKEIAEALRGVVTESTVRTYYSEFWNKEEFAWLRPYLPPPNPKYSAYGRLAWQRPATKRDRG